MVLKRRGYILVSSIVNTDLESCSHPKQTSQELSVCDLICKLENFFFFIFHFSFHLFEFASPFSPCSTTNCTRRQRNGLVLVTYHELQLDVICDIFQSFKVDHDLVLSVVQIAQVESNDVITFL